MSSGLHRRAFVGSALALAACGADAQTGPVSIPPLKSIAPFPVGVCIQAVHLQDRDLARLLVEQVSQLTPEWEMKMEYIAQPDGSFRFDGPDQIAAFARTHGLRLFGHTWSGTIRPRRPSPIWTRAGSASLTLTATTSWLWWGAIAARRWAGT